MIGLLLLQIGMSLMGVQFMWDITTAADGAELRRFLAEAAQDTAGLVAGFASQDPLVVMTTRFDDWAVTFPSTMMFAGPGACICRWVW